MRFLCVCEGGNTRSVAMAYTLKYNFNQEAVPVSYVKCSQESLDYFSKWADKIIVMQPQFSDKFEKWKKKLVVIDVGPDRWLNPLHKEIQTIVSEIAQKWANENFSF